MKSYEIIRQAVDEPGVKAVAADLKVSAALIYKWCEPPAEDGDPDQSGAKNPLDRVREMYQLTKDVRLIRWLCNEADGFFLPNPKIDKNSNVDQEFYRETRRVVRDFSELLDSLTDSAEDHSVDLKEADVIRQRWEDLKSAVERFVVLCEQGHFQVMKK